MARSAEQLDSQATAYSRAFPHFEENFLVHVAYGRRIADDIEDRGLRKVLSLGIGHMEVARPIVDLVRCGKVSRYVLIDAAPTMIANFRESMAPLPPGLEIVEAFFETYNDPDRFDVIEAGFVLEHVDDPGRVLRHMLDLISPGGRMFVAVPNARSLHRLLGHEAGLLPDMYELGNADLALGHQRYFDLESLRSLALTCGWSVECQMGLFLKPFTTDQMNLLELPQEVWAALQKAAEPYPEIANSFCLELVACR